MQNLSIELIKQFFINYPRLDYLFQSTFSKKRTPVAEKYPVFSETTAFIRLFPAFAYKQGMDPFSRQLPAALIAEAIKKFDPFEYRNSLQGISLKSQSSRQIAEFFGLPMFFAEHLAATYTIEFMETFLKRSVRERPLYLRKIGNKQIAEAEIEPVSRVPGAYKFTGKIFDFKAAWFQEGGFTIQDLSSQLACLLANPKPGNKALDACAGSGGKSMVLADLMQGKGELWALHVNPGEYKELKQRIRNFNLQNIRQIQVAIDQEPDFPGVFDLVLTDVACSGSGVIRRNPDLIYRLHHQDYSKFTANQLALLKTYSRFLKPGGKLIYMTCSLMDMENSRVTEAFLNESNGEFEKSDFLKAKAYYKLDFPAAPAQTMGGDEEWDCDGFFLAGMTRIKQ